MTAIAHCVKKGNDKWVAAGGKPFDTRAAAEAWAEAWQAEDPKNRGYTIVVKP
jgi:hypothetical protein